MLNKTEYLEKNKARFDKAGLSKADRSNRYRQYQQSKAMKTAGVVGRSKASTEPFREGRVLNTSYSSFSQCTKDYANALIDPWTVARPPCVPDNICLPSYKFGTRARGTFQVGLSGLGFVYACPYVCSKDTFLGYSTDQNFNSPNIEVGGVIGINPYTCDAPFVAADFGDLKNQSRVVGFGIRVRYTGTELTRSGQVISFRSPTNASLFTPGLTSPTGLLLLKETSTSPNDRDWHYCVYRPAVAPDLAYVDPNLREGFFSLLIAVSGGTPGASFEFDAVGWYEIIGSNLPNLTRSHSDPIGMAAVSMAMPATQPTRNPTSSLRDFVHEMSAGVATAMSFMPRLPGQAGMIQSAVQNAATIGSYVL